MVGLYNDGGKEEEGDVVDEAFGEEADEPADQEHAGVEAHVQEVVAELWENAVHQVIED